MRVDLLEYTLPPELIAQEPPATRDGGRLLVVEPNGAAEATLSDANIGDLAERLPPRSLLVVNDTRVIPARLLARKPETGGKVEIFLVRPEGPAEPSMVGEKAKSTDDATDADDEDATPPLDGEIWRALGKSSKPLRFEKDLVVGDELTVRILGRAEDDGLLRVLLLSTTSVRAAIETYGQVPLPPYIKRATAEGDAERYQTVFARHAGAVAAPTAGLHLTNALLGRLAIAGHDVVSVTLHVGLGTFQPVQVDDLDVHKMHEEAFAVTRAAALAISRAKQEKRPIVAVGTTVVRALEAAALLAREAGAEAPLIACSGTTKLLLQPGARLHVVDGLLTNFHLPRSTLLALVGATVGLPNLRRTYEHAIAEKYRFYSYGDAMLVKHVVDPEDVARHLVPLSEKPDAPPRPETP